MQGSRRIRIAVTFSQIRPGKKYLRTSHAIRSHVYLWFSLLFESEQRGSCFSLVTGKAGTKTGAKITREKTRPRDTLSEENMRMESQFAPVLYLSLAVDPTGACKVRFQSRIQKRYGITCLWCKLSSYSSFKFVGRYNCLFVLTVQMHRGNATGRRVVFWGLGSGWGGGGGERGGETERHTYGSFHIWQSP